MLLKLLPHLPGVNELNGLKANIDKLFNMSKKNNVPDLDKNQPQGLTYAKTLYLPDFHNYSFFLLIYNIEENCWNQLTQLVVLLAPAHQAMGYVEPWTSDVSIVCTLAQFYSWCYNSQDNPWVVI